MATISEAFAIALQHHQAGRLDAAEQIYRQILSVEPKHADSLQLLGLIAYQGGQLERALDLIGQAVALNPLADVYHNNLGLTYRGLGRKEEAVASFRRAVQLRPRVAGTHNNLGNALRDQGEMDQAIAEFRQALELDPRLVEAHNNLGNALHDRGELDGAIACYRRALQENPNYADALNNLGNVLRERGELAEGAACYRRALQLNPNHVEALDNLGTALADEKRFDEAIACYERVLQLRPDYAITYNNLGNIWKEQRKLDQAISAYRHALELNPADATAHYNLGTALWEEGSLDEAVVSHGRAIELKPDFAAAHSNLGIVLENLGRLDEAIDSYRRAVELRPDYAEAHNNLGVALYGVGRPEEAMVCYQQALQLKPDYALAHSNYLNALQYRAGVTPEELLESHREYDRRHAAPLRAAWRPHANTAEPERPLRLGFVSPSFGWHPAGRFLIRVLENLDRRQASVACYSDRTLRDSIADRFLATATLWRDVVGMSDDDVAQRVRDDGIDILFDLAGHTGPNRLQVFARKPAPIQITWLDYEGTTGLSAIDYLLADRYEVPPEAEAWYSERVLRLPDGYACYDPPADAPAVSPLPAERSGRVTFGSFNLPAKMTPEVVDTWSRILRQVPESRILLKYRGLDRPTVGEPLRRQFVERGINPACIELQGWSAYGDMLACYNQVDVALDPFPYNGGLTTCDALWMGVPVVTCPGRTFASRHGLTHLSNVGLTETIAEGLEGYVELAVQLASDLPRMAELRGRLRRQVAESPLCDGGRFAENLLQLLRGVWGEWCRRRSGP
jgi:predicted O-linked N-acetylglucosamine transferase (SPINDLY family)